MYCGLDIAKNKSNVCILDKNKKVLTEFEIEHNKEGIEKLKSLLPKNTRIGMEVTGNYSKALYSQLKGDYNVSYLDSYQLKNYARFISPNIKNDKIDARIVGRYLSEDYKKINPIRMNELKDLCNLYNRLVTQLTKYKCMTKDQLNIIFPELEKYIGAKRNKGIYNILLRYPTPEILTKTSVRKLRRVIKENLQTYSRFTIAYLKEIKELAENSIGDSDYPTTGFQYTIKILLFYQEQVNEIKKRIEEILQDTTYIKLIDKFGYNTLTIATLTSEIGDIRRFPNHKKFVSYCGLGVTQNESGSSVRKKGRISKRGNSNLRQTFYMLVLPHLRHKTEFAAFYQRLKDTGKHPKKCLLATSRKLAVRAYYDMMKCHE